MSELAKALLVRLRGHVHDCRHEGWPSYCRPERGAYCSSGRVLYDAFYDARKAEVMVARVERLMVSPELPLPMEVA